MASAQRIAFWDSHAHPDCDLKQNMVRFGNVLRKSGIRSRGLGITASGLQHEALIEEYIATAGQKPTLRCDAVGRSVLHRPPGRRHHGAAAMRAASLLVVDDTRRTSRSASVRAAGVSAGAISRAAWSTAVGMRSAMSRAC